MNPNPKFSVGDLVRIKRNSYTPEEVGIIIEIYNLPIYYTLFIDHKTLCFKRHWFELSTIKEYDSIEPWAGSLVLDPELARYFE